MAEGDTPCFESLTEEYNFIQDYYKKILENAKKSEADDLFSSFI